MGRLHGPIQRTWAAPASIRSTSACSESTSPRRCTTSAFSTATPRITFPMRGHSNPGVARRCSTPGPSASTSFAPAVDAGLPRIHGRVLAVAPDHDHRSVARSPTHIRQRGPLPGGEQLSPRRGGDEPADPLLPRALHGSITRIRSRETGRQDDTAAASTTAMCFRLGSASYLTMDGTEVPFDRRRVRQPGDHVAVRTTPARARFLPARRPGARSSRNTATRICLRR